MLTYELPSELIAQRPCEPRDDARLLVLDRAGGRISHQIFRDLPDLLEPGDCLVLNDTRVIPARLYGRRADTGGKVELLLLQREDSVRASTSSARTTTYRCLGQPGRRLRPGSKLVFNHGSVTGEILSSEGTEKLVRFQGESVDEILAQLGEIPLPPYIRRPVTAQDAQWYQTVFANSPGAVAAPTAGLHFTQKLLDRIRERGVQVAFVTLHVGWGTFKPVGEEELRNGQLHEEWFQIPPETVDAITQAKAQHGRIVAVGTTVVRTLETMVATGDASGEAFAAAPAVPPLGGTRTDGEGDHGGRTRGHTQGITNLFIQPGFQFQVVDAMITNFHLPGTSLLYLVAAFAGKEQVLAAYEEAIRQRYRFYSYGDAMFIQ